MYVPPSTRPPHPANDDVEGFHLSWPQDPLCVSIYEERRLSNRTALGPVSLGQGSGLDMRTLGKATSDGDNGLNAWTQPRPHTQANARKSSLPIARRP